MSKKHFIALADAIREHNTQFTRTQFTPAQLDALARFCAGSNPRFDAARWFAYIARDAERGRHHA